MQHYTTLQPTREVQQQCFHIAFKKFKQRIITMRKANSRNWDDCTGNRCLRLNFSLFHKKIWKTSNKSFHDMTAQRLNQLCYQVPPHVRACIPGSMLQAGKWLVWLLNWPNLSSHNMTLGWTQPVTEMSTRNLPGSKEQTAHKADNLTAICEPTV
jgi:hypothetical protein